MYGDGFPRELGPLVVVAPLASGAALQLAGKVKQVLVLRTT
jgi:hypothetical protein